MRNAIMFAFLFTMGIIVTSCSKADDDNNNSNAQVTANINGVHWESVNNANFLQKITQAGNPPFTQTSIAAYTADNHSAFSISITNYKDQGQGDCLRLASFLPVGSATDTIMWMGATLKNIAAVQYVDGNNSYTTLYDGQVTIASCNATDHTINGSFSFVGATNGGDTVRITDGKFNNLKFSRL